LKENGVGAGIHYPVPVHLQKSMAYLGYKPGSLPVTEHVVDEIISLPMYSELNLHQINLVVGAVKGFIDP
jgi:dTDP-4-amino-4,6-dideoxygalactose transaminase